VGFGDNIISVGTGSLAGTRLKTLSKEKGQISLTATSAQRRQLIHLGAFLSSSLSTIAARISQLAVMLMLSIFKNTALIYPPPF
jgi:hypothetical protein